MFLQKNELLGMAAELLAGVLYTALCFGTAALLAAVL